MIIKNLWAKELKAGDVIVAADLVDSKYGQINRFTVSRVDPEYEAAINELLTRVQEVQ